jgi:hypothetical protein
VLNSHAIAHFFAFSLLLRVSIADSVRCSFRAIEAVSIFAAISARSCSSSSDVHDRRLGRGPVFILLSIILPS